MCTGVCILTFFDSSWKKSLARSAIFCSGSSRQSAIALIWPLTFIMSLRMRCVSTTRVFFLTTGESSRRLHGMRGRVWGTHARLNTVATVSLCSSWAHLHCTVYMQHPELTRRVYPDRMIEVFVYNYTPPYWQHVDITQSPSSLDFVSQPWRKSFCPQLYDKIQKSLTAQGMSWPVIHHIWYQTGDGGRFSLMWCDCVRLVSGEMSRIANKGLWSLSFEFCSLIQTLTP